MSDTETKRILDLLDARRFNPDSLRWVEAEDADWARRKRKELPPILSCDDVLNAPKPPEWHKRDMEYQYRKGFYHGVAEAAELIATLYRRGGYVRPVEIANIIGDWTNDLRKWRSQAVVESPLQWNGHPKLKWTAWAEIKRQAHERDGWCCVKCGATSELEAHHVEAVANGGLPELSNLETLCKPCHRPAKPLHPEQKAAA